MRMKIEVANCRTLKYKIQRTISQLIIMLASANKQKAGINQKHFRAIGINFERRENPEVERAEATSISSLRRIAIFFLLISASPNVATIFSCRNATLYELCARTRLSSKNMRFPRQRNWMSVVYDARNCVSLTAREMGTYVHGHNSSFLRFMQVPLMLLAEHLRGSEWVSRRDPSRTTRKMQLCAVKKIFIPFWLYNCNAKYYG